MEMEYVRFIISVIIKHLEFVYLNMKRIMLLQIIYFVFRKVIILKLRHFDIKINKKKICHTLILSYI